MNIQNNCSPYFGSGYITPKGKEYLVKKPHGYIEDVMEKLDEAKDSKFYDLVYDADNYGAIYLQNKETKERFTINNPARSNIDYNSVKCDVRSPEGNVSTKEFELTQEECEKLKKSGFGTAGAYMPEMNLNLFKAIEATNAYKNSLINRLNDYDIC